VVRTIRSRLRSRLTFANVVALMALFVALSGGAYALTIPKNSVGAKQLKKNAVTRSKIRKGAVTSSKVKDRSLLAKDFKAGQLTAQGLKGDTGAPGVVRSTSLSWGGQSGPDPHNDSTFHVHRTIGSFSKASASSRIIVSVTGSLSSDQYTCEVQVRIDGKDAAGRSSGTFSNTSNPGTTGIRGPGAALVAPYDGSIVQSFSITSDFGALAAGTHTVTLWMASNDANNNCETDPYNYHAGSVVILETGT
jgi:hypothetical protein